MNEIRVRGVNGMRLAGKNEYWEKDISAALSTTNPTMNVSKTGIGVQADESPPKQCHGSYLLSTATYGLFINLTYHYV
jgi:hypothetical protein